MLLRRGGRRIRKVTPKAMPDVKFQDTIPTLAAIDFEALEGYAKGYAWEINSHATPLNGIVICTFPSADIHQLPNWAARPLGPSYQLFHDYKADSIEALGPAIQAAIAWVEETIRILTSEAT